MKLSFMKKVEMEFDTISLYPTSKGYDVWVRTDKYDYNGSYLSINLLEDKEVNEKCLELAELIKNKICDCKYHKKKSEW